MVKQSEFQTIAMTIIMYKIGLFFTSYIQVMLVACSTVFIANSNPVGIIVSSFFLSLMWTVNVKKIVISTCLDRITYAGGAAIGSLCGMYIAYSISKII